MYGRNQPQRNTSYAGHQHGYQQQSHTRHHTIHYGAQRPLQPPAGADPQLWNWFSAVDVDRSGFISVQELQSALLNGMFAAAFVVHRFINMIRLCQGTGQVNKFILLAPYLYNLSPGFDLDTVKMLMALFDTDRSGTIDFPEFASLWKYIADWQNVFRHFDRDRSGSIEGHELAEALRNFNYTLAPSLLTLIEYKYASAPTNGYGPPPGITFDRFVRACVVVKTLTEAFHRHDSDHDGWIQLNYDQFMSIVLSTP